MTAIRAAALLVLACVLHDAQAARVCSWDHPGRDPYTGSPVAAVLSYGHIPAAARVRLAVRMRTSAPDDTPDITRHGIASVRWTYDTDLHDMHFGRGSTCETVTRSAWPVSHTEPARAWCDGEWCVVVPDACGNVSWARRELPAAARAALHGQAPRAVPEPPAIALAAVAALAAWITRKMRNGAPR